jgi:DNA-binding MarR family transcriptional regulator
VPRSATEVVDQLEAKSLVARLPDPSDRRATLIVLTDAGAGLRAKVLAVRREQSDEFFSRLSGADRRELGRLLELLGTHEDCP